MFSDFNAGQNIELYKIILDDTGNTAKIKECIQEMKRKAKRDCEMGEKARRKEQEMMESSHEGSKKSASKKEGNMS